MRIEEQPTRSDHALGSGRSQIHRRGEIHLAQDGLCRSPTRQRCGTAVAENAVVILICDEDLTRRGIDDDSAGVVKTTRSGGGKVGGEAGLTEHEIRCGMIRDGLAKGGGGEGGEDDGMVVHSF